ncbi:hypothetical protein IAU59_005256 [Kwoniella sp. CBS 9459]
MAPSPLVLSNDMIRRQETATSSSTAGASTPSTATMPVCVSTCMGQSPTFGCESLSDYACLCASPDYINWVGACWAESCTADEITFGQAYSTQACAFYGVPLNGTTTGTDADMLRNVLHSGLDPTASAILTEPKTISPAFLNIQAIMSSICSALMVIAFIVGFYSVRTRIKADQAMSQNRTWNGVTGMTSMDSKAPKSSRFFTRTGQSGHSSAFTNSRGGTTTFGSRSENYGVTSSNFGGNTTLAGSPNQQLTFSSPGAGTGDDDGKERMFGSTSPVAGERGSGTGGIRFTNRLTLGELGSANKSEEWEMGYVPGSGSSNNDKDVEYGYGEEVSPTTIGSKMESEVDFALEGSTVHLNALPKEPAPAQLKQEKSNRNSHHAM